MHKHPKHTDDWRISDMAAHLPEDTLCRVDPQGDPSVSPSALRIKQLALAKRSEYMQKENEDIPVKKASFRVALIAALICLVSITAFAAFGGLDYIKAIFGDSAESIENEIVTPQQSVSAQGRDMALEALVTDGYVTNMVVTLTGDTPPEDSLFAISTDTALRSVNWHPLDAFSAADKTYYVVSFVTETRFDTTDITLSLNPDIAPIDMPIQVQNNLGNAVIEFPEDTMSGETQLMELQVSPMGFLLIAHEQSAQGGLPSTQLQLRFADGRTESIDVEFAPSDETVGGGGGAIIGGGGQTPLVVSFQGTRNPDGELVINGEFSRIINPEHIEGIIVDGVDYPVQ